ncbi:hypothetical protein GSI01S_49_00030 [Gordonia sihwensis NBRC 108236]|uniref:Uncharacterized protein n=1 Tax=Gordonia sihwensis NBRC 108236 TaxID=1223544 RepID=L7LQ57_9ACTN|nr:hypothetical protein GSI01S_49_00030 [Gordonia sihwensis NBRC 108236]
MHAADDADNDRDAPTSYYLSQAVATLLIPGTGLTVAEWVDDNKGPLIIADGDPAFREWLRRLRSAAADMLVTAPYEAWPISGSVVITRPIRGSTGNELVPPQSVTSARNSFCVLCVTPGAVLHQASHTPHTRGEVRPQPPAADVAAAPPSGRIGNDAQLRSALWIDAVRRLNTVREEFAAYETDATAFFHRPLLADRTHPLVQAFYTAFAHADALRVDGTVPDELGFVRDFADRAVAAETAWRAAYAAASASGDSGLSAEQRTLLRCAESAIKVALDDRSPPNERATAYRRVTELFGKAHIDVPASIATELRHQIESATRKTLPDRPGQGLEAHPKIDRLSCQSAVPDNNCDQAEGPTTWMPPE